MVNAAGAREPLFLAYKNLKPFVEQHLGGVHYEPYRYVTETGILTNNLIYRRNASESPQNCRKPSRGTMNRLP